MKNLILTVVLLTGGPLAAHLPDELEKGFLSPPDSAKPHTWWHWMNGNVTKEGITADLEAMARVGIGGAQIFNVDLGIPAGPVKFMGPEWRAMIQHAAKEADRLGLGLSVQNCAGWSTSGGPWITPANAMQRVSTSEVRISGPQSFSGILPQPPTKLDFYRDIAVFAFRTPEGENTDLKSLAPKVSASMPDVEGQRLLDDDVKTFLPLPRPQSGKPQFVQLEFARPFSARSIKIAFPSGAGECNGVLQISDDGKNFRDVRNFAYPRRATVPLTLVLGQSPVSARFYRVLFTDAPGLGTTFDVGDFLPSGRLGIEDIGYKSVDGVISVASSTVDVSVPSPLVVRRDELVDLTSRLKPDGRLDWNVPAGEWTILRIGYTPTGKNNHPAPAEATGPECDKFSKEALDAHWTGMMKPILDAAGPLAGKSLNNVLVDSYEAENQNWTPKFREEFQKLRGYDPLPFLPVLTGRVVDNPAVSERFLWDFRRTISDLFASNYFEHFQLLCHQAGLSASIEPYGGPFDPLQAGAPADIPMGEFWVGQPLHDSVKLAASAGHIYGHKIIGSESFTAAPGAQGRWQDDPFSLKALGDLVFCRGINRLIFHRYAMQPWTHPARCPGMTMGMWGMHFDRTNTWWEQGSAWLKYLARCQYMLQQGRFVADAAYFHREGAPAAMQADNPELPTRAINLALPAGYDYDGVDEGVLKDAVIKDGQLVLKSGMRYSVLILSPSNRTMTPALLRLLRGLVAAGLTLVGPPPSASPSLTGYPECDVEVRSLVGEMWGNMDGRSVSRHSFGKGQVIWGQSMEQVFTAQKVKPDFEFSAGGDSRLDFIHRLDGDADYYFVSNQRDQSDQVDCTFRVSGRVPELWNPETGDIAQAPVWREEGGRTTVPLAFDPVGSVFVVFRKPVDGSDHIVSAMSVSGNQTVGTPAEKLKISSARYESIDSDDGKDVTAQLAGLVKNGALSVLAGNGLFGDPAGFHVKRLRVGFVLDGRPDERIVQENTLLEIFGADRFAALPGFKIATGPDGLAFLSSSVPCTVGIQTALGRNFVVQVSKVPKSLKVSGPWDVAFPPNWGAPAEVHLPELLSWTEYPDDGVKYFSGTATYIKEVDIPAEMFADGKSVWLDLGQVKNFAGISVNGNPSETLWKPPFRMEITAMAVPGKNKFEIKITNLWPNRLIGDEQLPPDCDWAENGSLKQWPAWLQEGKPSPTGRLTFTTWHLWKKEDKPLLSGLLGPVIISSAVNVPVTP